MVMTSYRSSLSSSVIISRRTLLTLTLNLRAKLISDCVHLAVTHYDAPHVVLMYRHCLLILVNLKDTKLLVLTVLLMNIFCLVVQTAVHICLLLNALLSHAFVPNNFCHSTVVPLLKNKHGDATSLDMYRGITLLPVISKIFESVLLELFNDFLVTDNLQFGFKKNSTCSHALFAFTESVKYFVNSSSKVYGAFLDVSKAFDKVLHNGLFIKRLDRGVPPVFVTLLRNWYSKLHSAVRWNNSVGVWFPISCGVPQGGVFSPYLFACYVDDLIARLKQSGYGIHISQVFFGCLLYADDIALLSPYCHGLQKLMISVASSVLSGY